MKRILSLKKLLLKVNNFFFIFIRNTYLTKFKMLNFDYLKTLNDQKEAVTHLNGPLLIVANSFKTKVLTSRISHIILSGKATPDQVLAVTLLIKGE